MKKRQLSILLLSLMIVLPIIPSISAVDITLSKNNYNPTETLQVEITGNFISLNEENILIYEENTPRAQPVISDFTKQGNIYYFYAVLPIQQGNYSLKIENSEYTEFGQIKTDTLSKEFIIKQSNQSALQINPGFILTSEDFSINIKAINLNQDISVIFNSQSENISLIEETQESLDFSIQGLTGKQNLKIGGYEIPVFIIEKIEDPNINLVNQTNQSTIGNQTNPTNQTNQTGVDVSGFNETEIEEYIEELGETQSLSCYDIGRVCLVNQECKGETVASLEGSCCIGECEEIDEGGSGLVIGIILLIVAVVVVGFLYWRSKKKQKPGSPKDILKEKESKFSKRMETPGAPGAEVRGTLGKI